MLCVALQVDCRKILWGLLALMAKHQGQLKVNYSGSSSGSKAAGLLRGAVTAAAGAAVSAATAGVTGGAAPVDTDSKSGSASGTPKAGASAPSPAAGGKCGGPRATVSLQPLRALQRSLLDLALPRLSLSPSVSACSRLSCDWFA